MALTLTFALIVGTILALTVVPVLASFRGEKQNRGARILRRAPAHEVSIGPRSIGR
jgi:Cu/Ag efflux pump CusA